MSGNEIGQGGTSVLLQTHPGFVTKRLKRKGTQKYVNLQKEKRLHQEIYAILNTEADHLQVRAPKLKNTGNVYTMEQVNINFPLYNSSKYKNNSSKESIVKRVKEALQILGRHGIILKDSEAFYQPDSSIVLLDFGQAYKAEPTNNLSVLLQSAALLPANSIKGGRKTRKNRH